MPYTGGGKEGREKERVGERERRKRREGKGGGMSAIIVLIVNISLLYEFLPLVENPYHLFAYLFLF